MDIIFLIGLLFGVAGVSVLYVLYDDKTKNPDKKLKWVLFFAIIAIIGGIIGMLFSIGFGKKIAKKYLTNAPVRVLEAVDSLPFYGSFGAYIVTGENNGKKVTVV